MAYIVAIDGTAGSGKGTVTKLVAEKLKMINIDTGIIYRSITYALINNNISIENSEKIESLLQKIDITIEYDDNNQKAILNNIDITSNIRTNEVNSLVSKVAGLKIVRDKATDIIRNIAAIYFEKDIPIIMEGRDITTVVFPNAEVKIYMDASLEARVNRRIKQNTENGIESTYEEIEENIKFRDYNDMHHEFGALKQAEDAIYLDTTELTISEVVEKIIDIINKKLKKEGK